VTLVDALANSERLPLVRAAPINLDRRLAVAQCPIFCLELVSVFFTEYDKLKAGQLNKRGVQGTARDKFRK